MHLLVAFLLLICSLGAPHSDYHRFIVFTHDGTFYKLDPQTKEVQWHNELPFKLLSLSVAPDKDAENKTKKIFIPTIDGDFIYLEHTLFNRYPKQILVPREDVEHLLDMCFDSEPSQKYFVYEKLEYFVLNTENGQYQHLEEFLYDRAVFNRSVHTIIIVAKKLLKQLNQNMEVKWSVISSKVTLTNVDEFMKNPKVPQSHVQHPKYSFVRTNSKTIEIQDEHKNVVFEIQAFSSIVNIFAEDKSTHQFSKMAIKRSQQKLLALSSLSNQKHNQHSHEISRVMNDPGNTNFQNFPSSNEIEQTQSKHLDNLEICLKAHKLLKQSQGQSKFIEQKLPKFTNQLGHRQFSSMELPEISFHYTSDFRPQDLPTLPFSSDKRIHVIITKEQPFVYIFIICILVGGGFMFYRFKVNKLWEQISQIENVSDQKMKNITAKLGEYENVGKELKKMYEVNWDKILYRNKGYFVFEGRFLNQTAEVFMVPLNAGYDIIDIQHKLNILINVSHKSIVKLYYYSRNEDTLLIFCESAQQFHRLVEIPAHIALPEIKQPIVSMQGKSEDDVTKLEPIKIEPMTASLSEIYMNFQSKEYLYKHAIQQLMDTIGQLLQMKIQIPSFKEESVLANQKLQLRVNIIPSFLVRNQEVEEENEKLKQMGTTRLRLDLIKVVHKIGKNGEEFDLIKFEKQKHQATDDKSFLQDFYDHFLLTEGNADDLQALKCAEKHPFLWDAKQKMLYVCDFSNYMETCIDESKIGKMQSHCRNFQIVPDPWNTVLHPSFTKEMNSYRKYDFRSIRDLIRLIRNKLSHFHEIPKEIRVHVGKTPEQFVEYCLERYPKLLSFMYVYATKKKWKLSANQ